MVGLKNKKSSLLAYLARLVLRYAKYLLIIDFKAVPLADKNFRNIIKFTC